jgi:hypothetical protein
MTKTQPETHIRKQITDALRWDGWYVMYNFQGVGSVRGVADLYCLKEGRSVWLEVKTPTGRQSDDQRRWEAAIRTQGGEYRVARRIEDVADLMGRVQLSL